jgi:nitrogen regulatory protein PII
MRIGTLVVSSAGLAGPGFSHKKWYRGLSYMADSVCLRLEFAVEDERVDDALKAAADAIEGTPGAELLVVVTKVDDVVRIRSGPCGVHMS